MREIQRAWIVLLAAEGWSNRAIGDEVGMHYNQVAVWRRRFAAEGMTGLIDIERPGRPPVYGADDALLLVKTVTEKPPEPASRWTMQTLARRLNQHGVAMSATQVWRVCQELDLKPPLYESWLTLRQPRFWASAADVCGLYVDPPQNVVVWSVDRQVGRGRRQIEHHGHGTAALRKGLNVHDGYPAGCDTASARADTLVAFLSDLVSATPNGQELHAVVDGLSAQVSHAVTDFLNRPEHQHVFLHRTPTHSSWLNQVEVFFAILQRRPVQYGDFCRVDDIAAKVVTFINDLNRLSVPFNWMNIDVTARIS